MQGDRDELLKEFSGEENQEKTNNHFGGLRLSVVFKATNLGEILQCLAINQIQGLNIFTDPFY